MNGTILKITGLTPQLEMEAADLLDGIVPSLGRVAFGELFATFDADGKAVGLASAERHGENCLIYFVVVRQDSRRKGTGSALVNHVLGYFAGKCDRAYVAARGAEKFFERFGFSHVGADEIPEAVIEAGATMGPGADGRVGGPAATVMMIELPSRWTIP